MATTRRFYARGFWVDKNFNPWITSIMIIVHIGLGSAIMAGGSIRFASVSYVPLNSFVAGEIWVWGMWILLSAVLMSIPFRWVNIIGLWLGMFWHIIWMACFTLALVRYDDAVSTAAPAYAGFAMICAALLTARLIEDTEG